MTNNNESSITKVGALLTLCLLASWLSLSRFRAADGKFMGGQQLGFGMTCCLPV